ncbi:MAG TPA: hypothetical protein VMU00_07715 [Steroidobacteraceae bacterium]|nr:hypothetical protein [Steroidobacteraceae bacterium]
MADADASLAFLTALAALATRLAADGVVVHAVSYQSHGFGGWEVEAGRRRTRVRVRWQGKDRQLVVETAELASGSHARSWQLVEEHDYRDRRPELAPLLATTHAAITAHAGV